MVKSSIVIRYSKNGVEQNNSFYFIDGVLATKTVCPSYGQKVDITHIKTENELFEFIKDFSYTNEAEITHRNGKNIEYHNTYDKELIKSYTNKINDLIKETLKDFIINEILPIVKRNKWSFGNAYLNGMLVLIYTDENNELSNIDSRHKDNKLIESKIKYFFNSFDYVFSEDFVIANLCMSFTSEQLNEFLDKIN